MGGKRHVAKIITIAPAMIERCIRFIIGISDATPNGLMIGVKRAPRLPADSSI